MHTRRCLLPSTTSLESPCRLFAALPPCYSNSRSGRVAIVALLFPQSPHTAALVLLPPQSQHERCLAQLSCHGCANTIPLSKVQAACGIRQPPCRRGDQAKYVVSYAPRQAPRLPVVETVADLHGRSRRAFLFGPCPGVAAEQHGGRWRRGYMRPRVGKPPPVWREELPDRGREASSAHCGQK